jgi:hypothetical protein
VIEALKRASALLEPRGVVLVIEPLNTLRDHPGMFLTRIPQAYMICRAVGSPSCKVLFDLYHQQITEGNILPNAEAAWSEIAYFQVGDNPGRKEPGTGEMNYRNIFAFLKARGYDGIVGMEHGNSRPGRQGERAVIDAYVAARGLRVWTDPMNVDEKLARVRFRAKHLPNLRRENPSLEEALVRLATHTREWLALIDTQCGPHTTFPLDCAAVQIVLLVHLTLPSCSKAMSGAAPSGPTATTSASPSPSMSPVAGVAAYWTIA